MLRNLRRIILITLLITIFITSQVLAAPSIRFIINGARQAYGPGSVFMLYGRAEDSGFGLPYSDILVQVESEGDSILYSQTKADDEGYFRINFNFPYNSKGSTFQVKASTPESLLEEEYELTDKVGLSFNCMGFSEKIVDGLVPLDLEKIFLVFTANINYFFNKGADPDLRVLGKNEKNMDCVSIYEKDSGKPVDFSIRLVPNNSEGDENLTFYKLDGKEVSDSKKRIMAVTLKQKLAGDTTYVVEIDREMAANNSSILGEDLKLEFTTDKKPDSGGTPGHSGDEPPEHSGGGSSEQSEDEGNYISGDGGIISKAGATITVPANAFSAKTKVTLEKIDNVENLAVPKGNKLISDVIEITKDRPGEFTEPVKITLKFDKSMVNAEKYDINLCWLDEEEGKWVPLDNIKVDLKTGEVSGDILHFTKFAVIATEKYHEEEEEQTKEINLSDVTDHWAEDYIWVLTENGIIEGYPDQTFKPDNKITRAEFVTILVRAFELESDTCKVFNDTANHWAKDFVAIAAANGVVGGYSDTIFGPDDNITREQMAVMIFNAAKLLKTEELTAFEDSDEIAEWAQLAVASASAHGIITGYPDNTFQPQGEATRAEASTVIVRALEQI